MKYLAALAALGLSSAVCAADSPSQSLGTPLEDRFRLTSGVFSATTTTDVRIDATDNTPGTQISAEDDFGLRDRSELADIEVQLRPRPRHKLRLNYFQLNRSATTQLQRQISFGDDTYLINDSLSSKFNVSDFGVAYSYMFLRRERFEIGASFGLHLYQFEADARVPARLIEENEERTGPVPALGLEATVRFNRRWHAEARGEYLNVEADDFEASLKNLRATVFYRFNNNVSVGAGYMSLSTGVLVTEAGDSGRLDFDNSGGELLLRISF